MSATSTHDQVILTAKGSDGLAPFGSMEILDNRRPAIGRIAELVMLCSSRSLTVYLYSYMRVLCQEPTLPPRHPGKHLQINSIHEFRASHFFQL